MTQRGEDYEQHRERKAAADKEQSRRGRDIGDIPKVKSWPRRKSCQFNFRKYCEVYHGPKFPLAWSPAHLLTINLIQTAVLEGIQALIALPRGTGKTVLCCCGIEWAVSYGHRKFPMLIAADEPKATRQLEGIKIDFETNELIAADFPEICYPVKRLERIAMRQKGQLCNGVPTFIHWGSGEVVLPVTREGKERGNAGCAIRVGGITSAVRGANITLPWGEVRRPDLVLLDDPQTRETAASAKQSADREDIVAGDVLGMAGPGKRISALMAATPIKKGDMVDALCDDQKHPEWQSIRQPMIISWPTNMDLWKQYAEILRLCWMEKRSVEEATEFYENNRSEMDEGAEVYWPERVEEGHLSALQTAMGLWIKSPRTFAAEYQLDPEDDVRADDLGFLDEKELAAKVCSLGRREIPVEATHVVAAMDVQLGVLPHVVAGFAPGFRGNVVDYGTWPEQNRWWTSKSLSKSIQDVLPGQGFESALLTALRAATATLEQTEWKSGNQKRRITLGLIDAAWGPSTDTVFKFCRDYGGGVWFPAFGVSVRAAQKDLHEDAPKGREETGPYWRKRFDPHRDCDYYRIDSNFWKTTMQKAFATPELEDGSLMLYDGQHEQYADHLGSEYPTENAARGRKVVEWTLRPNRENHWLDCTYLACAAASIQKVMLPGTEEFYTGLKRRKVRFVGQEELSRRTS